LKNLKMKCCTGVETETSYACMETQQYVTIVT
jgi:hypothetical protein